jgi:hypothetical protein
MENSVLTQLCGYHNLPASGTLIAADGMTKVVIDPDDGDMDNTTLDLAVAATSARTGDVALNYDLVRIAAGAIGTGACTHTLGDGQRIGQIWAVELVGAVTGYAVVITITNVIGGQTVFNLNSKNEGLIVRWNGYAWEVLVGRTANICGGTTCAGGTNVIPITHRYVAKTTGGAEAGLTLAAGTFDGQKLTISLVSDGGDGTLTPATATGWGTCVFVTEKDTITLQWIDSTIGWVVIGVAGTAAATLMEITGP